TCRSTPPRSAARTRLRSGSPRRRPRPRPPARSSRTRTPERRWKRSSPGSTSASSSKETRNVMANILVYALHYDGAINKNSLGAVSEGARLAAELGGEAHAILLGENVPSDLAASLGNYG